MTTQKDRYADLTGTEEYLFAQAAGMASAELGYIIAPYELTSAELPDSYLHLLRRLAEHVDVRHLRTADALCVLVPSFIWAIGEQLQDPGDDAANLLRLTKKLLGVRHD